MKVLPLLLLCHWILLQFTCTRAALTFTFNIISHSTSGSCDTAVNNDCETFFTDFCLRGPRGADSRSTSATDCPFGRNTNDLTGSSGSRIITSSLPWQGGFQLFFEALDDDGSFNDPDHLSYVFIDRSLAVGPDTTPVEVYRSGRITLQMRFRVECQEDYYGEDCAVFCEAQNSIETGFYTCDQDDGSRICLDNYFGPDCNTFCQESNSLELGFFTCNQQSGDMICNDGFTGTRCTENIDDCAEGPCQNGGTCTDMVAGFECNCLAGYTGGTCLEDINECLVADCPGNSTCVEDAPNSFLCQCNPGFEGDNCTEIQPCETVQCQNGGTCVSEDPFSHECLCPLGFNGTSCEIDIDECSLVECENGGTCTTPNPASFECVCPEGFSGDTCELDINECLFDGMCPAGTSCVNAEPGFRCVDAQTSQQLESQTRIIIIGAAVGGAVVALALLIIIILIIILLTRRKMKYYRADRSQSHIYQPSPTVEQVKCVGLASNGHVQEGNNPLYGTQLPETAFTSEPTSPEVHTFDNVIYEGSYNPDAAIYDQIRTDFPRLPTSNSGDVIDTSTNISYESLWSPHRQQAISNPMYVTTTGSSTASPPPTYSVPKPQSGDPQKGDPNPEVPPLNDPVYATAVGNSAASPPPTYSVPRPVSGNGEVGKVDVVPNPEAPPSTSTPSSNNGLEVVDGYTVLNDGRSFSPPLPSPSAGQPSAVPLPQENSTTGDTESGYALPASRHASREGTTYNKLQHISSPPAPEEQPPVVRLSALPGSGYSTLETEY